MYLYSKWSDSGRRMLEKQNCVWDIYELIGIHRNYLSKHISLQGITFQDYFNEHTGTRKYHYRNIGERFIKQELQNQDSPVFVPRKDFRWFCRTKRWRPIVTSSTMGVIFTKLVEYVFTYEEVTSLVVTQFPKRTPSDILSFQFDFLQTSAPHLFGLKGRVFREVLESWVSNKFFVS